MNHYVHKIAEGCILVLGWNNAGCLDTINLLTLSQGNFDTYYYKVEDRYEHNPKYPKDLWESNTVPTDHDEIHSAGARYLKVTSHDTQNRFHWHWKVCHPSASNNTTSLAFLQAFGLMSMSEAIVFFDALHGHGTNLAKV